MHNTFSVCSECQTQSVPYFALTIRSLTKRLLIFSILHTLELATDLRPTRPDPNPIQSNHLYWAKFILLISGNFLKYTLILFNNYNYKIVIILELNLIFNFVVIVIWV